MSTDPEQLKIKVIRRAPEDVISRGYARTGFETHDAVIILPESVDLEAVAGLLIRHVWESKGYTIVEVEDE